MKGKEKGIDSIMNYIKKAVIISLFTMLTVMIRPCTAKAATGGFTVTGDASHYGYDDGLDLLTITGDCTVENTNKENPTSSHIKITNGCTVTLAGVKIESSSAAPILISISSGTVTLNLSETNTVKATGDYAGIEKDGDNSGSLIITSEGDGTLTATGGGNGGAGIGGGRVNSACNITINGGNVTATSDTGAGIGGGFNAIGSNITISGGIVTATTNGSGAGIGGGFNGSGSDITISGGNVKATSGTSGAGIGGGQYGSGSNITISGGKVIAESNGQTPGSAIGKGNQGANQLDNSITPSSTSSVNVWKDTDNESGARAYTNYPSTLDISSWENNVLMIIFDKINVASSNSSSCNHHYEWEVEKEPTETQDGELVYTCSLCGDITARQPLSSYDYFIYKCMGKIRDAKAGDTVTISSKYWNSYPKTLFKKLAERRDITVKIQFTYKQKNYETTIAPDKTIDTSCKYYGPLKLMELYGASEVSK